MRWTQLTDYCLRSDAGYYVAKVGGARGWTYEAWYGRDDQTPGFLTADSAKEYCETQHAQKMRVAA